MCKFVDGIHGVAECECSCDDERRHVLWRHVLWRVERIASVDAGDISVGVLQVWMRVCIDSCDGFVDEHGGPCFVGDGIDVDGLFVWKF